MLKSKVPKCYRFSCNSLDILKDKVPKCYKCSCISLDILKGKEIFEQAHGWLP